MKIMKILPFFLALAKAMEPIKTVSCDRGADQETIWATILGILGQPTPTIIDIVVELILEPRSRFLTAHLKSLFTRKNRWKASPNEAKYLVLPEFPAKYHGGPTKCIWTIQTSAGSRIQVKIPEIMSCQGNLTLIDWR